MPGVRKKRRENDPGETGFTLIEMIASLLILGVLATYLSLGVAQVIKGFFSARDNAETALVAQTVLTRLSKEFSSIDQVSAGSKTSITYSMVKNGSSIAGQTLSWAGTANAPLYLNGSILTEQVKDFELTYHNSHADSGDNDWQGTEKIIGIRLKLTGASDIVSLFTIFVTPRNL